MKINICYTHMIPKRILLIALSPHSHCSLVLKKIKLKIYQVIRKPTSVADKFIFYSGCSVLMVPPLHTTSTATHIGFMLYGLPILNIARAVLQAFEFFIFKKFRAICKKLQFKNLER